jgi:hypothetical protein
MRSTLAVLCLAVAACRLDAQANRRARLTLEWSATPQEQQNIERAFLSSGWPLVRGHGPADRATLMLFLSRHPGPDTLAQSTAWTARVVDIESGAVLRQLSCTTQGSVPFQSDLPLLLRREFADSTAAAPTRTGSFSCKDRGG